MTPVALLSIADLDHAVNNLTDALITATDATETSTDSGWYIESAIEELRTALTEVASLSRAAGPRHHCWPAHRAHGRPDRSN